jgi:hypothetical protein
MANATVNVTKKLVPVTTMVEQEERRINLELSENEAKFLRFLGMHVGGHPKTSPRGHMERIVRALDLAGIGLPAYYNQRDCLVDRDPGFRFKSDFPYNKEELT